MEGAQAQDVYRKPRYKDTGRSLEYTLPLNIHTLEPWKHTDRSCEVKAEVGKISRVLPPCLPDKQMPYTSPLPFAWQSAQNLFSSRSSSSDNTAWYRSTSRTDFPVIFPGDSKMASPCYGSVPVSGVTKVSSHHFPCCVHVT